MNLCLADKEAVPTSDLVSLTAMEVQVPWPSSRGSRRLELIRVLQRIGFTAHRQKGSHRVFVDPSGRRIVVPVHAGRTLSPKVLKDALRNAALSVDEFIRLLKRG